MDSKEVEELKIFVKYIDSLNNKEVIYNTKKYYRYSVVKIRGDSYLKNVIREGETEGIFIGKPFLLETDDSWLQTSKVESIRWKSNNSGTFKTLNSIYKFKIIK